MRQTLIKRADGYICKEPKPTEELVHAKMNKILSSEHMNRIFNTKVTSEKGFVFLDYPEGSDTLEKIRKEELGKRVLFTDRDDFSNEEAIDAYRSTGVLKKYFNS